ncbi:hypothetical protein NQ318_023620 [Aromia moschata]|uniref:BED-type domain-containing protein n=1 Tax=Aromia moschata TaxID=1265417 RepID=A0AAV8YS63_9CUCU|nr:hypothetical protein NQ318_023620 [Aromia moschata]
MDFHKKNLFTDESCFTRRGITDLHNQHVYADENPHAIRAKSFKHECSINVWMGFINNSFIGPIRLPNRLDGNSYSDFLQNTLPDLFDDLPLNLRNQMYFMHDGVPPQFARIIGRGNDAPISWPPRSPDLNPCDFFIWGDLKQKVYSVSIENEEQLWNRIQNAVQKFQNEETLRRVHIIFLPIFTPTTSVIHQCLITEKTQVWNFFIEHSVNKEKCNLCSKMLSYKGETTGNLIRHLKLVHPTLTYNLPFEPTREQAKNSVVTEYGNSDGHCTTEPNAPNSLFFYEITPDEILRHLKEMVNKSIQRILSKEHSVN